MLIFAFGDFGSSARALIFRWAPSYIMFPRLEIFSRSKPGWKAEKLVKHDYLFFRYDLCVDFRRRISLYALILRLTKIHNPQRFFVEYVAVSTLNFLCSVSIDHLKNRNNSLQVS